MMIMTVVTATTMTVLLMTMIMIMQLTRTYVSGGKAYINVETNVFALYKTLGECFRPFQFMATPECCFSVYVRLLFCDKFYILLMIGCL